MSSTIGGDDPAHDLSSNERKKLEKELRTRARALRRNKKAKDAKTLVFRAEEVSRKKSKRQEHH